MTQETCKTTCGEAPCESDPALSNGVCAWCGYWNVPPGPQRDLLRRSRAQNAAKAFYE